ncbi:hypothetical protein [Cytobacillus purgationiresistens]|uniref:Site-specific recombinase XerD n=1 Tax=Cytobacillus purgationiresistens TaxID=863449 RepID=A0ABU0AF03_9BACI|nr:hypothetical protein [Cytobacillus purgationiresistens]MDQ0268670.1 site-specific recombinase XerD [Cytobacillus purgationiresistens]
MKRAAENYQIYLDKFILKYFDDGILLENMKLRHVENFINKMHEQSYSPATIKRAYNIIGSSLDYAVSHNLIVRNVAKGDTLPKADKQERY